MADGERELIDAEEVAAMLGMTVDWVYEQSRRGRIPTITLGRYRRYRRAAIEAWLLSIERGSLNPTAK
jgi:excisionase family DNA binding protein